MYGSWRNGVDGDNKGGAIKTRLGLDPTDSARAVFEPYKYQKII